MSELTLIEGGGGCACRQCVIAAAKAVHPSNYKKKDVSNVK